MHQAPLSMGFSGQVCWSGLPFPCLGDLPNPGTEPGAPAFQVDPLPFMTIYVALKDLGGNQNPCLGLTWKDLPPS